MATTAIDHYELLCRLARERGLKVKLRSDHFGGKLRGDDLASQLTALEVTDASDELLARVALLPSDRLWSRSRDLLQQLRSAGILAP